MARRTGSVDTEESESGTWRSVSLLKDSLWVSNTADVQSQSSTRTFLKGGQGTEDHDRQRMYSFVPEAEAKTHRK